METSAQGAGSQPGVSRLLLACGAIGSLLYIVVFLIEGATRPHYSAWHNLVSTLSLGEGGWIQIANFIVSGALVLGFAIGLRLLLRTGRGSTWGPILLGIIGLCLIGAGIFVTDPTLGYPPGASSAPTVHGIFHDVLGQLQFFSLIAVCFVLARRDAANPAERGWAWYSVATGLLITVFYVAFVLTGVLDGPAGLMQRICLMLGYGWIAWLSIRLMGNRAWTLVRRQENVEKLLPLYEKHAEALEETMESSPRLAIRRLARLRGTYGFDEPVWPLLLGLLGVILLIVGFVSFWVGDRPALGVICLLCAILVFLSAASYVYTTRRGKFQVWATILLQLGLRGDEQVLDLGCGRGMVLLMAARLLTSGKATGIDIWNAQEQSGNALAVTRQNAEREGVADRVSLHTADMRHLPFSDHAFDLVVSSLAIHNIRDPQGQEMAITEAVRVLKPGGRLIIADFRETQSYRERLRALDMNTISLHPLGWRFWYSGPWAATALLTAQKTGKDF